MGYIGYWLEYWWPNMGFIGHWLEYWLPDSHNTLRKAARFIRQQGLLSSSQSIDYLTTGILWGVAATFQGQLASACPDTRPQRSWFLPPDTRSVWAAKTRPTPRKASDQKLTLNLDTDTQILTKRRRTHTFNHQKPELLLLMISLSECRSRYCLLEEEISCRTKGRYSGRFPTAILPRAYEAADLTWETESDSISVRLRLSVRQEQ